MQWIFVVGIEGSGHHAIADLFRGIPTVSMNKRIDLLLAARWEKGPLLTKKAWQRVFREERKLVGKTHYLYTASFPFNQPRSSIRRPSILEMVEMLGDRLTILVLNRDPVRCVASAMRRGFGESWYQQTMIAADNLRYIQASLPAGVRYQEYDSLVLNPRQECERLARDLEVPELAKNYLRIRPPSRQHIPAHMARMIRGCFAGALW